MSVIRSTDTDESLVARTAAGDMDAYAELYKRYLPVVRAFARRRTGDMDRADELTQEIFLDAWRSAGRYDPKVAPVGVESNRVKVLEAERFWLGITMETVFVVSPGAKVKVPDAA